MGEMESAPLGQPNDGYTDLPLSWRAAMAWCPHCSGTGWLEATAVLDASPCLPCRTSGDLFGAMLVDAYERGRDHMRERLREVEDVRRAAAKRVLEEVPSQRQLRSAMGIGGGKDVP